VSFFEGEASSFRKGGKKTLEPKNDCREREKKGRFLSAFPGAKGLTL